MISTNDVRRVFLEFFRRNEHEIVESSPLVPHNDPTLMFTNAGMVQFKDIFTGVQAVPDIPRAASSQKCVRAGGKHNDLDNVGYTARHHTFFEMLGNFSFGDYFKEQAIELAWELLTKDYALSPERLFITVYHTDDEAFRIWKSVTGFSDDRILRVPTSDNFWAMGDTGPCGPCSEIFYDHGEGAARGEWALDSQGRDLFGDRFIEIWNLVFMQYEQLDGGTRNELPRPSIDTGMGLERMAAVLQGVHDNYDIDLFRNLISVSEEVTGTKAEGDNAASHKVIADHLRSVSFLIADGVMPSNEGRGYVLRRIMRRAMRHLHMLGVRGEAAMYKLVPVLIEEMGAAFPELGRAEALITETLRLEEERFQQTLGRGLKLLDEEREGLSAGGVLSGEAAFRLYDTYGFPLDLTQDILRADGISVDVEGFDRAMEEQKSRARAAWKGSGDSAISSLWFDVKERCGATEFVGYDNDSTAAIVKAIIVNGEEVESLGSEVVAAGSSNGGLVVLNQTVAYAESGGQVGDSGVLLKGGEIVARFEDTTKPISDIHAHKVFMVDGVAASLGVGDEVEIRIDVDRREKIRANHSATHLLHAALRRLFGEHITQKGSRVADDSLRFDISHPKGFSIEELHRVELEVNRLISQNSVVHTRLMNPDEAIKAGAMALFGEKYGDEVRVLSMGEGDYSVELCGGTHVRRTGDIGLFKIVSEGAIAAGIRRIEAVTGEAAIRYIQHQEELVRDVAGELKVSAEDIVDRIVSLLGERKSLQKELSEVKKKLVMLGSGSSSGGGDASADIETIDSASLGKLLFVGKHFDGLPPKELRSIADSYLSKLEKEDVFAIVVVTSCFEGKGSVVVALSKSLVSKGIKAADYVQIAVPIMGGKGGGGRPEMAQGGGADGSKCEEAIEEVRRSVSAV